MQVYGADMNCFIISIRLDVYNTVIRTLYSLCSFSYVHSLTYVCNDLFIVCVFYIFTLPYCTAISDKKRMLYCIVLYDINNTN